MSNWISWLFIILASFLLSGGNLCIKQAKIQGDSMISPLFLGGLAIFACNMFFYSKALECIPLSIAYPVFAALGFLLITVSSIIFFQETLTVQQWIGLLIILVGLGLIVNGIKEQ